MIFESEVLETKARLAAIEYYSKFETEEHLTEFEVARKYGITKTELNYYMAHHPDIGKPENREEAIKYKSKLEEKLKS